MYLLKNKQTEINEDNLVFINTDSYNITARYFHSATER